MKKLHDNVLKEKEREHQHFDSYSDTAITSDCWSERQAPKKYLPTFLIGLILRCAEMCIMKRRFVR
ncbi:MAG: hypothetical protein WBQ25_03815 [Nitrososphaeraceae archaeon]